MTQQLRDTGRMPKHAMKGVADIFLLYKGKCVFIEVKTQTGRLSKEQEHFAEKVRESGGYFYVAKSIDDAVAILTELQEMTLDNSDPVVYSDSSYK